jgi:hypothetical protein
VVEILSYNDGNKAWQMQKILQRIKIRNIVYFFFYILQLAKIKVNNHNIIFDNREIKFKDS